MIGVVGNVKIMEKNVTKECKCGHTKAQHWYVLSGEMPCVANRLNELDEDEEPCLCFDFSSKETK